LHKTANGGTLIAYHRKTALPVSIKSEPAQPLPYLPDCHYSCRPGLGKARGYAGWLNCYYRRGYCTPALSCLMYYPVVRYSGSQALTQRVKLGGAYHCDRRPRYDFRIARTFVHRRSADSRCQLYPVST